MLEGTELIGQTFIDLEDRFYSNCYATCGLPRKFSLTGYNAWRDCLLPKQILFKLCKKYGLAKPEYSNNKLTIYNSNGNEIQKFPLKSEYDSRSLPSSSSSDSEELDDEINETEFNENKNDENEIKINKKEEQLALDALNNWKDIAGVSLVPEHIETRSLYNPNSSPDLEQGKIQLWIDIFPISDYKIGYMPKPVDISIRKPK